MSAGSDFIGYGLHDAVLETIRVDWPEGIVELELRAVVPRQDRVVLRASGLVELTCPRHQPWGTGDHVFYVNDVREERAAAGATRLDIELGSGDVIRVVAAAIVRPSPIERGDP